VPTRARMYADILLLIERIDLLNLLWQVVSRVEFWEELSATSIVVLDRERKFQ